MDTYDPNVTAMETADRLERMYPDVYAMIYPHVRDMAESMSDDAVDTMASADLGRMTDEALRRSGLLVATPAGHNPDTLHDMARTLMVRDIADRHRRRRGFPFFFPFFFFPDGRRLRDFDRGFDRGFYR